jgi:predicted SnoaL-like aldol condensation-catalyzing enzyme
MRLKLLLPIVLFAGMAIVNIFRVENGRVAEHWDVMQAEPEKSANLHPMF